ncbi:MAG: M23 family metallopeptidase [Ruminococcaceae bacterium]|nr:M23 family metallopeptidase [Oscillospiraceae bacterium]
MNNSITKKQNRILLISLVVILAAAAVLVALTGSANKKSKTPENPPISNVNETDVPETSINTPDKPDKGTPSITETTDTPTTPETEASADVPDDKEVSAVQPSTDVLPTFSAPVDSLVLKGFSADVPVFSTTMNDYRTHKGLDFACSPGTPVFAAADGTVCEIVDDPMMGVTVSVQHTGGAVTKYKGLSEESMDLCKVGDTVKRGQVIGASGDTALIESAEESHLHFELYVNGKAEDPGEYMQVSYLSDLHED